MKTVVHGISIRGISAVVPEKKIENRDFLQKFGERKVKMQLKVTGINRRHIAHDGQEAKDLCLLAAKRLLQKMEIDRTDICVVLFVSQSPSFVIPSTAFWIHDQLGLPGDCIAYDINLGCSGFVEGLNTAASIMQSQEIGKKGLLLNADTLTHYINEDDEATSMIFGDAGTATLIERNLTDEFVCLHNVSSANYDSILVENQNQKLVMDGMQVFSYTLEKVVDQLNSLLKEQADYDFYLLHQAQKYIVDNIASLSELSQDKVLTSFAEYGNTSGASIPLTVCKNKISFRAGRDYRILISGFGAGLSCASAAVTMKNPEVMEVIEI